MSKQSQIGGSFAPPLSDQTLGEIDGAIGKTDRRTQDAAKAGAPTSTTHIRQTPTGS